jgi:ABC-2 type transport system permease protein
MVADMDSLQAKPEMVSIARDVNLNDMLFRYGVRINPDLLMDIKSMPIPVKTGQIGNQPQFEYYPWYYMPLITPHSNHPAVVNLNAVKFEFVSSMDTVDSEGVKKTILLRTSTYTRVSPAPAFVSLEILKKTPDDKMFPDGSKDVAVLLEGRFTSVFKNRIPPEIASDPGIAFMEESAPTRMIVISDGDVFCNQISAGTRTALPLGYDQYTGETFGNRDLLLNLMNYLTDESGLIQIRSRELKLRSLDQARINKEKTRWQLINVLFPIIILSIFGLLAGLMRRRYYARQTSQD